MEYKEHCISEVQRKLTNTGTRNWESSKSLPVKRVVKIKCEKGITMELNGHLLIGKGDFCIINESECYGILMDNETILEIDSDNNLLLHENKDYSLIMEYPLTKEAVIQLLPRRKYSLDESYTVYWYINSLLAEIPFSVKDLIWIVNNL